ncbi:PH domain-containing protein [Actinophytocola glycyrrhizae]|uniref:PH domain-containing protein n=1 Tax=Actinophytocola glycyrrhizae TaxID=2044873 RepID=A0ABV9SBM4_9PSEU
MEEQVRLRPPANRVDPRAVRYWMTGEAITNGVVALVLGVLAFLIPPARPWLLLALGIVLVIGIPYMIVMPIWRYRVHRWEITEDAVYTRSGWLWQEWRVAPMSRIQTVDTKRGPLEQAFRLSSVTVTTASAAGPITIKGLDHEVAAELADTLTEVTQANRGDAT